MVLPLVLKLGLLTQAPVLSAAAAHAAPTINAASVRVWLSDSSYQVGARARVFVNLRDPGYVVVLHADAAGRVRVLFPRSPDESAQAPAGTPLEVAASDDRAAFLVPAGSGGRGPGGGRGAAQLRRLLQRQSGGLVLGRDRQPCDEHLSAAGRAGTGAGLRPLLHPVLRPAAAPVQSGLPAAAPATGDRAGGEPAGAADNAGAAVAPGADAHPRAAAVCAESSVAARAGCPTRERAGSDHQHHAVRSDLSGAHDGEYGGDGAPNSGGSFRLEWRCARADVARIRVPGHLGLCPADP